MKKIFSRTVMLVLLGSLLATGVVFAQGYGWSSTTGTQTATPEVQAALLEALTGPDGEYAAYAMYTAVIDTYGQVEPYVTIREAEGRHIEALKRQLDRYGIDYPTENPYIGQVTAPESLAAAAQAWADGEIANVELYDKLISQVPADEYPNVVRVLENLRSASLEAHLPAFQAAAENGGTLTTQQMQDLSPRGKDGGCNGGRQGGHGRGNGNRGRGNNRR